MTETTPETRENRRLPLSGAVNFRDIGGIEAGNDSHVKTGKIFRADHLSRLTDGDHRMLHQRGLRTVCDLRSRREQQTSPDRLPTDGSMQLYLLPVESPILDPASAFDRLRSGDLSWLSMDSIIRLYRSYLDDFAPVWAKIYTLASSPDHLPLVFHCTGGKDRTGICSALLLDLLGVNQELIVAEHLLSNRNNAERLKPIYAKFRELGVSEEQADPYLLAPVEPLLDLFDYLRRIYGTTEDYLLTRGGMKRETVNALQTSLTQ